MDILERINNRIPRNIRICFLSGIVTGWITHFYMLTHKLPNWDDISQINDLGLTKQIGRWMLEPLQFFGLKASNPAIHGMLLIVFISLAACFVVNALELKSATASALIPAIMVTFPSVTSILYFMFTAHLYSVGILLLCLSVYLIHKFKYGFIPAGICIILGLAIYQPFISISISLMLMILIMEALRETKFKKLVCSGLVYAGTLVVSTFVYVIVSRIIYPQMSQETYGGVSEMGKISLFEMPRNIGRVYKRVLEYFAIRPFAYITPTMRCMNICVCIMAAVFAILIITKTKMWKNKLELVFLILMAFLLPFALGFVYFMAPNAPFSTLMLYAYCMLYVFVIALSEELFVKNKLTSIKGNMFGAAFTAVIMLIVVYSGYLVDSQAYFRTDIAMNRATNYFNRIISAVENTEGYSVGDRVAILGDFYYKTNPSPIEIGLFKEDESLRELDGVALENGLVTSGARNDFIRTYIGFNPGRVTADEREKLLNSKEYKSMPTYPADGSIAQIDDVWVVKLCE